MKKFIVAGILSLFVLNTTISQEASWFYLRAKDTTFVPEFRKDDGLLKYVGPDIKLKSVLEKYTIFEFKKTYKKAKKENLKKTFFVIADRDELLSDLLVTTSHLFEFGEIIAEEDKKIFEPNDYGLTSTIGENIGLQVNLDYLDFLEAPKAWYYTTGSPDVIIGISDGRVDTTDLDFKGKTTMLYKLSLSKGHGYSISANAAAQGDNGHGIPGICYDCGIYGTTYGDFRNFRELMELSKMGVKVINCSWIGRQYYETGQAAIDEMFENGTIIVAAAGNKGWDENKGKVLYYPAAYNHVISVSSVMHKHDSVADNILISDKGNPYASNIKNYLGRAVGFVDHDTLKSHFIYHNGTAVLNPQVDILAPTVGLIRYADFIFTGEILYNEYETTSGATPFVSGTIGLMFSLVPCLPVEEVESILKSSATNIDYIEANKPYAGNYGAGSLNTGRAVELLYKLYTPTETAFIQNQIFSRWNFIFTAYSEKVVLRNQVFKEDASLTLTAKNKIVIAENTVLKPNSNGKIQLKIDPSLSVPCDLRLRTEKE